MGHEPSIILHRAVNFVIRQIRMVILTINRDVKSTLSFKLKSVTSDQHSARYKPADEQTLGNRIFF